MEFYIMLKKIISYKLVIATLALSFCSTSSFSGDKDEVEVGLGSTAPLITINTQDELKDIVALPQVLL